MSVFHFQLTSCKPTSASGTWQWSRTYGTSAHGVNEMARWEVIPAYCETDTATLAFG